MKYRFEIEYGEEELDSAQMYIKGPDLYLALWNTRNILRQHWKYAEYGEEATKIVDEIWKAFHEVLREMEVEL